MQLILKRSGEAVHLLPGETYRAGAIQGISSLAAPVAEGCSCALSHALSTYFLGVCPEIDVSRLHRNYLSRKATRTLSLLFNA